MFIGTFDELMKSSKEFTKMINDHVSSREGSPSAPQEPANSPRGNTNVVNAQGAALNIQEGRGRSQKDKISSKEPPKKLMTIGWQLL